MAAHAAAIPAPSAATPATIHPATGIDSDPAANIAKPTAAPPAPTPANAPYPIPSPQLELVASA